MICVIGGIIFAYLVLAFVILLTLLRYGRFVRNTVILLQFLSLQIRMSTLLLLGDITLVWHWVPSTMSNQFVTEKAGQWLLELKLLSFMAQTQPHTTFAAFTHGMANKWTFLSYTITHIGHLLQPLDTIIRTELIPFLTRRLPPNNVTHDLFALT